MSDAVSDPDHARLPELDALRGLAALAVVLFHFTYFIADMFPGSSRASLAFTYGWFGVQLFFAISGFVILLTLGRTTRTADFLRTRFWRLFPTYWLAALLTFVAMRLFGPVKLQVETWEFAANLSMIQLYLEPLTGARMVDGAYWSLNVELLFYAGMLLLWRLRLLDRVEMVLAVWLSLKWAWPWLNPSVETLLLLNHLPFFAIGIATYRIHAGQRRVVEQLPLLLWVFVCVTGNHVWPAPVLTAGLIAIFLAIATGHLAWFRWRPLGWLGDLSYPLYLLHGYIGLALILHLRRAGLDGDTAAWLMVAVSIGLAAAVVHWFERPLLRWRRGGVRSRNGSLDSALARA